MNIYGRHLLKISAPLPLSGIYQMIPHPAKKSRWTVPLNTQYVVHIQAGIKEIS
jgi:hypothetical protein